MHNFCSSTLINIINKINDIHKFQMFPNAIQNNAIFTFVIETTSLSVISRLKAMLICWNF